MADLFGDVIGEMVKYVVQIITKGLDFGPTLKTGIETLNVLVPLVEKIKGSNDLLDRPREDIEMLETHIREIEEIVEKSKKLTWWNVVSRPRYQAKLQKKDEALQKHLSVNVQVENKSDLKMLLAKVEEILQRLDGKNRRVRGAPEEPQCMGMDELLTQLKIEMMNDGVLVRVLTGLGGSGKTTLVKKLCSDPQIKGKFGANIFFFTVSKTPNWKIIVQMLFEYCGRRVPEFNNDEDAISQLTSLLSEVGKNPILLVLDDVWPGSESLVEKFKFEIPDYKILVTSRDAFRRFGTPFKLDLLDHDLAPYAGSEIEAINQIEGIISRNLHPVRLPNATWQKLFNADNIWRLVGLVSSVVGLSCYALSPSFNRLIGTRKPFKFIPYGVLSLVLFTTILFAKKSPSSTRHDQLKSYTTFAVLMIMSVYAFFYDRAVNGKPDILNVVSNAAFVLVSLSLHKLINFGFEIGVFSYFLGCFAVQLFTINWMLILIAIFFGCPLFVMHSSLNSQPQVASGGQFSYSSSNSRLLFGSDGQHVVDIDS